MVSLGCASAGARSSHDDRGEGLRVDAYHRVAGRTGQTDGMLSRVNTLREEPGGAGRLFVSDMNGPLYILDKDTRKFTPYLDFNGRDAQPGIFHRLVFEAGYGNGLAHFQFDPDYARNGRFYTVHIENPADRCVEPSGQHSLSRLEAQRLRHHAGHRHAGPGAQRSRPD